MRFFNTAGPIKSDIHYCFPPLERFNLGEILHLIEQQKYFVLHAPRQTGKTSCMLALMEYLNNTGKYNAIYFNVELAQGARENVQRGIRAILNEIGSRAELYLGYAGVKNMWKSVLEKSGADGAFNEVLTRWAQSSELPLILFIDEIDSLVGDTLISVLRQMRAGYDKRPENFPQSIILCGVRDVRDYRIHSSQKKEIITGGSAFNIKAKSLKLGNFSKEEIEKLYDVHTKETGQKFEHGVIDLVWELTKGQPWLTNALGYEVCFDIKQNRDPSVLITSEMINQAKENIILRRETHLDQLTDKLKEERVKRVIEPILFCDTKPLNPDDVEYVSDLGLVTQARNGEVLISNKIYSEVIPRTLSWTFQLGIIQKTKWYVSDNGSLDTEKLILKFQEFFRENSESWIQQFNYREAGPQLLLQAFLQRIVNSGGEVHREYALGRRRTDILVKWPYQNQMQKIIIELKILYKSIEETIKQGLIQTKAYMDKCGSDYGHLVIFDRNKEKSWDEKIFHKIEKQENKTIHIWGM